MTRKVLTGFYRWYDIKYEWPNAIDRARPDSDDASLIQGILSVDALTHADHPLRAPGAKGVEFYFGTLKSGEKALMFSSAQVDYLRYWLHAMNFTKEMIPLPYSDCLLPEAELPFIEAFCYETKQTLIAALSEIDGNNMRFKRLAAKGIHRLPDLSGRRDLLESVRKLWSFRTGVWCAVDFEGWEGDRTGKIITEFGYSFIHWGNGKEVSEMGHLIVKEHQNYTNGKYVSDNRKNYNFGSSKTLKKSAFRTRIQQLISGLQKHGPLFLVFHDHKNDLQYLTDPNVNPRILAPLEGHSFLCSGPVPTKGIFIVDTNDMYGGFEGNDRQFKSLESMCQALQIPTSHLHNAGNDAHYTILAARSMATVDAKREQPESKSGIN